MVVSVASRKTGPRKGRFPLCLLDTSDDLDLCSDELGCPTGSLVTPLNRLKNQAAPLSKPWAIDNGAFSGFDVKAFKRRLGTEAEHSRSLCLFVALPDVVGSARRTLECFHHWKPQLAGWPIALVAQDGIEDLDIPWYAFDAIFVGGTTPFKVSSHAVDVVKAARIHEKWVHIGRVNTPERMVRWLKVGIDSFDGSALGLYSHMRRTMGTMFANRGSLPLFPGTPDDTESEA